MITTELSLSLEKCINEVCDVQTRYRVLWVIGPVLSGKTSLLKALCEKNNWKYINYTLDSGFLDSIFGREETYRPDDFYKSLESWCNQFPNEILVVDEIEPVLSLWNSQQKNLFFQLVGKASRLKSGVVIVTRRIAAQQLLDLVPGSNHIFQINGD